MSKFVGLNASLIRLVAHVDKDSSKQINGVLAILLVVGEKHGLAQCILISI